MSMLPHEPLVSVIMGVRYCREDLNVLEQSVNSILAQTVGNFEFLICEWGSNNAAKAWLEELVQRERRVRILPGKAPGTLAQNLNICLGEAKGKYIARMDDDDFSHPARFAKQLAYLECHPEITFVGSNVSLHYGGKPVGIRRLPELPTVRDFYITQPFIHPALMFRREAIEVVKGYSENRSCILCEDYDLLLRLYTKGVQGANLQETLLDYTIPVRAKGNRTMIHRWNETVTRWRRFKELKMLPSALPYVVKPLMVGLAPERVLKKVKEKRMGGQAT